MKQLNSLCRKLFPIVLLSITLFSCSSDKDPVVSKVIESVEIWEGDNTTWEFNSTLNFTYNNKGKLTKVKTDPAYLEATYTYNSANTIEYNWREEVGAGLSYIYEMSTVLQNGRAEKVQSNELGTFQYTYRDGYLTGAMLRDGNTISAEYEYIWEKGNLTTVKASEFSDSFVASSVSNEYDIDLNILPHFIDERSGYIKTMNSFGQLINIMGKKSRNLLENKNYSYQYSYDEKGRLLTFTMQEKTSSSGEKYMFKISYRD